MTYFIDVVPQVVICFFFVLFLFFVVVVFFFDFVFVSRFLA